MLAPLLTLTDLLRRCSRDAWAEITEPNGWSYHTNIGKLLHDAADEIDRLKHSEITMKLHKAKLLQIKLLSRPSKFMYSRLANASQVFFLWFDISWRRSWLPQAAYAQGWDAAFRQFYGIGEAVEPPLHPTVGTVVDSSREEQTPSG